MNLPNTHKHAGEVFSGPAGDPACPYCAGTYTEANIPRPLTPAPSIPRLQAVELHLTDDRSLVLGIDHFADVLTFMGASMQVIGMLELLARYGAIAPADEAEAVNP
jgi:hypothetical protein